MEYLCDIHNTYNAVKTVPSALKAVGKAFSGGRFKKGKAIILLVVIMAMLAGFVIAGSVIYYVSSREEELPLRTEE